MDDISIIAPIIAQLGVGGIFLWLYINKDKKHQDLQDRFADLAQQNIKTNTQLEGAIRSNTEATKASATITQKVWETLVRNGSNDTSS